MPYRRNWLGVCAVLLVTGCASDPVPLGEALRAHRYHTSWFGGFPNLYDENESTTVPVEIAVDGDHVRIQYAYMDGVVDGTISGSRLTGTWTQPFPGGRISGGILIEFKADGLSGEGWWTDKDDPAHHRLTMQVVR